MKKIRFTEECVLAAHRRLGDGNAFEDRTALEMALTQRRPEAVIHHSDRGCQYGTHGRTTSPFPGDSGTIVEREGVSNLPTGGPDLATR